jgi:hypothetical protein
MKTTKDYKSGFSVGERVKPRQVSEDFIQGLISVGASKELIDSLSPRPPGGIIGFIKRLFGK